MGDRENEFRNQLRIETNKSSITDNRSAQQRAIDGLNKMTPRSLDAIMNPSDNRDSNRQKWGRRVGGLKTPIASKEEQGSYECDRDGE